MRSIYSREEDLKVDTTTDNAAQHQLDAFLSSSKHKNQACDTEFGSETKMSICFDKSKSSKGSNIHIF